MDIAKKLCNLIVGKGLLFNADDVRVLNALNKFYEKRNLYNKLVQAFIGASLFGRAIIYLAVTADGSVDLQLVNQNQSSRVGRISETEQLADLWVWPESADNTTVQHITLNDRQIRIDYLSNNTLQVGTATTTKPDDFRLVNTILADHGFSRMPLIEIRSLERPVYFNAVPLNVYYPDCWEVRGLLDEIDHLYDIKHKETEMNRTRMMGDFDAMKFREISGSSTFDTLAKVDGIINVQGGAFSGAQDVGTDKAGNSIGVMQGDPKIQAYDTAIDRLTKRIYDSVGLDYRLENEKSSPATKTASVLDRENNIITAGTRKQN